MDISFNSMRIFNSTCIFNSKRIFNSMRTFNSMCIFNSRRIFNSMRTFNSMCIFNSRRIFNSMRTIQGVYYVKSLDVISAQRYSRRTFRPCPHVSGNFFFRKYFFADAKIFASTRSVFESFSGVHTYPIVSGNFLICSSSQF